MSELRELINQINNQNQTKHSTTQSTEIKVIVPTNSTQNNTPAAVSKEHISNSTNKSLSEAPMKVKREEWEKQMLKQALASLKENPANAGEEIQTATFGGAKYRVIHHIPSEMLRIVDEKENHRGTLYKAQRGKPALVCNFTEDEKKSFEHDVFHSLQGLQQG